MNVVDSRAILRMDGEFVYRDYIMDPIVGSKSFELTRNIDRSSYKDRKSEIDMGACIDTDV